MATRCLIGTQNQNGSIQAIYCHFDGYPLGVGVKLLKGFNNVEDADYLIEGGSIRSLGNSLQETWDENNQPDHWMTGPNQNEIYEFDNVDQYREDQGGYGPMGTEFLYLQNHIGNWTVWDCHKREMKALEQAVRDAYETGIACFGERDDLKAFYDEALAVLNQVQQQPQEEAMEMAA